MYENYIIVGKIFFHLYIFFFIYFINTYVLPAYLQLSNTVKIFEMTCSSYEIINYSKVVIEDVNVVLLVVTVTWLLVTLNTLLFLRY